MMNRLEKTDLLLLIAFFAILAYPILYSCRFLDSNTLTSWQWTMRNSDMFVHFLLLAGGIAFAYFLSKLELGERYYPVLLFAVSFSAVLPLWNEPEVILDASRYFLQAKHLELYGIASFFREWGGEIGAWTDLPVVPFLFGLIFRYLGESRAAIQLFTTVLFSLTVVSTYRIGKALWSGETGLLAGLLLLGFPYLLTQVPLMLVDVPAMFFVTLSMDAFLSGTDRGGLGRMLLAVGAIALTVFTKYSTWFMLPVLPIMALVLGRGNPRAFSRRAVVILSCAGLLAVALFLAGHAVFLRQLELLRAYQWPGLARWSEGFASTFLFQVHPFISVLALLGIIAAGWKRDVRFLIPAWFVLFVLLLQVNRIRYLLPLFPLLALMAAYGLHAWIDDQRVRRFTALCAAAASLVLVFWSYLPFLSSTTLANLRDAGGYIDALPDEAVEVRVLLQQESAGNTEMAIPLLDLYTRKRLVYRQDRPPRPDDERIGTSPLRFTWEFKRPAWYSENAGDNALPVVALTADASPRFFGGTAALNRFAKDTGTFRYKTFVIVQSPNHLAETAQ